MISNCIVLRAARIVAVACLFVSVGASLVSSREWTDNTGKYHVEAEFVKVVGETVHLRKPDGRVITVEIARLNEAGRQAVAAAAHQAAAKQGAAPAATEPIQTATNTIRILPKSALPPANRSQPDQSQTNQSQAKQNRPSLATVFKMQQEVWQARMNARLQQAAAVWNVASRFFDHQSATLSKWEKSLQPRPLTMGPAEAIQTAVIGLKAHRPRAIWDALPLSYQRDLHAILHNYGTQMDPELWQASRQVLQKSILVMRTKEQFLFNYPLVQAALEENPASVTSTTAASPSGQAEAQTLASWQATVGVLELLAASDLADLKKLRTLDVGLFLDQTGVEIMQQRASASRQTADDSFNQGLLLISSMQVSQVSMVGAEATIRLTSGQESELNSMVLVEGKWIPTELAQAWPGWMSTARAGLAVLQDKSFAQRKPEWIAQLHATEKSLDDLLAAKTQAQFNALLDGLLVAIGEQ